MEVNSTGSAPLLPERPSRTVLLDSGRISVHAYRCRARRHDRPFEEQHTRHSISFVRAGSFGCRCRAGRFDLVPGSVLVGHPGDPYVCSHEHHDGGDECLSLHYAPDAIDAIADSPAWRRGMLPPSAQLSMLAEPVFAAASGSGDATLEEAAWLLADRFVAFASGSTGVRRAPSPQDRARAVSAALWIAAHSAEAIDLERASAAADGLTRFHFLRVFARVLGVTPHQYLLRCRLRHASRLLAQTAMPVTEVAFETGFGDLSNFVRSFGRAAGMPPARWRAAHGRAQFSPRPAGRAARR